MLKIPLALRPHADRPMYMQLYEALARQIRSGQLAAGTRMPGKRSLAEQLAVSVNTIDAAYQMLVAEGYLESRPKSGFFVLECTEPLPPAAPKAPLSPAQPAPAAWRFDLSTGSVDTSLFPFRTWGRIQKEILYSSPQLLSHGPQQGDEDLRAAIAEYLRAYRGVLCSPEQIVVGAGQEYLLGLIAHLLPRAVGAVENPGYSRARRVLELNGVPCRVLPIDQGGLQLAALRRSDATLCYLTPSHHFPTGVTMPAGRRAQLLAWARQQPGRYLLEDDYDSEFRFDIRPLPSLQGMAGPDGPVIYLSTFSKSLAPSIRIACMVLPGPLVPLYRSTYALYNSTVSRFEQQTLCRFIREGHFTRHLARMRLRYKARMESLCTALRAAFGTRIQLRGRHNGLHLLLSLDDGPGETEMVRRAAAQGVRITGLSTYYMEQAERCTPNTVVLGYAALPEADIPALVEALDRAWSRP